MNKYQEALEYVIYQHERMEGYDVIEKDYSECIANLSALVEKATPKKIIKKEKFKSCDLICPSCHKKLSSKYYYEWCKSSETTLVYKSDLSDEYCCNCGQKLGWDCN